MLKQVAPPRGHAPKHDLEDRSEGGRFRPRTKGNLARAIGSRREWETIAPASPRPVEMLSEVTVNGRDVLTADDRTLHELLVSHAYADDRSMPEATHSFDMSAAIRILGPRVERSDVRASLERLKNTSVSFGSAATRRFEDVRLLEGYVEVAPGQDMIRYRLPEPLRALMREQNAYAYIELAALPKMRSKFSGRLYSVLAFRARKEAWVPGGDNFLTVTATPDEVAAWVGFPLAADGKVHVGKLKERFLTHAVGDFAAVRAFSLEMALRHGGRGNALQDITFTLRMSPPERHTVPVFFNPKADNIRIGGRGTKEYRVESRTWRRAARRFQGTLPLLARDIADLWSVALHEALGGVALSEGYHTRAYRGRRLLEAAAQRGADYAAWGFVCEEADQPDLLGKCLKPGWHGLVDEAEGARLERAPAPKRERRAPAFLSEEGPAKEAALEAPSQPVPPAPAARAVSFEDCREVILTCDEAINRHDVEGILAPEIRRWTHTGNRIVSVTIRFLSSGAYKRWNVGAFPMSEDDLDGIQKALDRYLDGPEELAA